MSGSEFIRTQPVDMPAAEVIAKAKAAGIGVKSGLVYEVRALERRKTAARKAPVVADVKGKPATATATPAPKKPAATSPISKSDWIRAQPASLTAAELVAKAKEAGIKMEPVLVYTVRGRAKAKDVTAKAVAAHSEAGRTQLDLFPAAVAPNAVTPITPEPAAVVAPVGPKPEPAPTPVPNAPAGRTTAEDLLRAVASEIGLRRAIGLLEEQRARVLNVIGG
jgi:hypothetical protein